MGQISRLSALGATALILYFVITKIVARVAYERKKRLHGCAEVAKFPHKDPVFGLDLLVKELKMHTDGTYLGEIERQYDLYGKTFEVLFFGSRMIRTKDPKNIQTILGHKANDYGLQPLREGLAEPFFGRGINTTDGEYWQYSRSLIKPTFSRVEICNFTALESHFGRLMDLLPRDGTAIDLQPLFSRLFLDSSTEFLFGKSTDTLLPLPAEEGELFIQAFDYAIEGLGQRVRLGPLKFLYRNPKWYQSIGTVHAFVEQQIDEALEVEKRRKRSGITEYKPDHRYVLLHEMVKSTDDKLDLRSQILAVFMPSRETTSSLITNVFHALARNPDVWAKLRKEVLALGDEPLTFELLKATKYLQWVINETHRVWPVSAHNPRNVLSDSVLPTGGGPDGTSPVLVRKGDFVFYEIYAVHHNTDFWGPDAKVFRPERWENVKPYWNFIPFGGGPRTCPAQQLVGTEVAYVIVRMVQEFARLESADEHPWTEQWKLGPHSKYGCRVVLTPA